ncbi:MAG: hypothetical protein H6713_34965 [Myxococcales bacterium]|nr:hypothetical protein [Myxococcales bacterium]
MGLTSDQINTLAQLVVDTAAAEIDCDEFLRRVGELAAALAEPATSTRSLREAAQHLKVCPECQEELRALLEILELESR